MIRKALLSLLLFAGFLSFSQNKNSIKYTIKGLENGKAFLAVCRGNIRIPVDTVLIKNETILFAKHKPIPIGVYRIIFRDSLFTDIIFDNEDVEVENTLPDLRANIKIIKSDENKIFYDYWAVSRLIKDTIDEVISIGNRIYQNNGGKVTPDLDSMEKRISSLSKKLFNYSENLINISQGKYVQKLLKAYVSPDYESYKKLQGVKTYKNRFEFLREHYFDNVDFNDTTLLNSEVFINMATDYVNTFSDPPTNASFIKGIDVVLSKASVNKKVYDYLLKIFMDFFENNDFEEVYVHLVEDYYLKNSCSQEKQTITLTEKVEAIKKLKPGNSAPDIKSLNEKGSKQQLYTLNSKYTLVFFWSSSCPHCEEAIPELIKLYNIYKPKGFEIFAVSLDTNKTVWQNTISKNKMTWINVCDFKGIKDEYILRYNIWHTPSFYILDKDKVIIARPLDIGQLRDKLKKII